MAGGISINILSNVREAVRGVDDVADALDDAHDRMRDLTKEGDTAADRLEGDFREISRAADRSSDQLRDKFRAAYRDVKSSADDAADSAVRSQRRMSERSAEVGQEIRQNLGEGIANAARGDFAALSDTIGDTLGGAVAGIGGIGFAAVGAAGALGVGALVAALSSVEERTKLARERAVELATTMYENQGQIPLAERAQELIALLGSERLGQNPFENILRDFLDLGTNIDLAKRAAELAEVPMSRLLQGLTGTDLPQTKTALDDVNDALERMNQESGNVNLKDFAERQQALQGVKSELERVIEQTQLANDLYNSTDFLNRARIDELSEAWRNAATDAGDYFSKTEEGATTFDWSTYLANAEATVAAADEMKARLVGMPAEIKAEAERIFAEQGAVSANEYTKAYESASAADKGRFVSAASANGAAAGEAQASALRSAFGNPVLNATVRVGLDTRDWDNWQPNPKTGVIMATRARNLPEWE